MTSKRRSDGKGDRTLIMSDDAQKSLIEFLFNTTPDKMAEMTIVSARQAYHLAQMMAFSDLRHYLGDLAKYYANPSKEKRPDLFLLNDRWMFYFMQLQRSIQGHTLKEAGRIALTAVEVAAEDDYPGDPDKSW